MKSHTEILEKELKKIEGAIHRHGMWRRPAILPVQVRVPWNAPDQWKVLANMLNRIQYIRCLPFFARIFGPAKSSTVLAYTKECRSDRERFEFVRVQLNQLIMDLQSLERFKNPPLEKIAA